MYSEAAASAINSISNCWLTESAMRAESWFLSPGLGTPELGENAGFLPCAGVTGHRLQTTAGLPSGEKRVDPPDPALHFMSLHFIFFPPTAQKKIKELKRFDE